MTFFIDVKRETLSDGSHVFAVRLNPPDQPAITIDAVTGGDAYAMAQAIADAIKEHSNESVHANWLPANWGDRSVSAMNKALESPLPPATEKYLRGSR